MRNYPSEEESSRLCETCSYTLQIDRFGHMVCQNCESWYIGEAALLEIVTRHPTADEVELIDGNMTKHKYKKH